MVVVRRAVIVVSEPQRMAVVEDVILPAKMVVMTVVKIRLNRLLVLIAATDVQRIAQTIVTILLNHPLAPAVETAVIKDVPKIVIQLVERDVTFHAWTHVIRPAEDIVIILVWDFVSSIASILVQEFAEMEIIKNEL